MEVKMTFKENKIGIKDLVCSDAFFLHCAQSYKSHIKEVEKCLKNKIWSEIRKREKFCVM